jgi:predicted nucleic acid-binding protein
VSVYLDASVLVALVMVDALTARADAFFRANTPVLIVSTLPRPSLPLPSRAASELEISRPMKRAGVFSAFNMWTARATLREEMVTADVRAAGAFLRRLDLSLRTADALNIAIAQRIRAALVTFDQRMAAAARALGVQVVAA